MAKVALMLLSLSIAVPASTPIAAGRWELTNQMEEVLIDGRSDGASLPTFGPQSACMSPTNAANGPGLAFSDPTLCRVLKSSVADGAFSYETECKAAGSRDIISTKASGSYTSDSYVGKTVSTQRRVGTQIEMRSIMKGKRLGDC